MILNKEIKLSGLANQLCNDFGLDTISAGGVIAFIMEATQKGLLSGWYFSLEWGNADQVIEALRKIAYREDNGDVLAEGVMRLAQRIGGEQFAMHTKGLEIAYHEPRGKIGLGLSYAVSPRGGSHMEGFHDTIVMRENSAPKLGAVEALDRFDIEGKVPVVVNFENARSFTNSLILCSFDVAMTGKNQNLDYLCDLTSAAMGIDMTFDNMLATGARIYNMLRMVANREGCKAEDDDLPDRFKHEPLLFEEEDVENTITMQKLDKMLVEYYRERGWDDTGKPTNSTIEMLDLPRHN